MNQGWERVSLGDIVRLERRPIDVVPDEQYREIGIYCFGKGIFHKRPRAGFEVGDKKLYALEAGDLILQITFAWEGAVALVSDLEKGMVGSTRYPTFRTDESRCHPSFLINYFRTHEGMEQLVKISPGSAGRNRVLSLKRIPEVLVPLPPVAEQQRIVARIEALYDNVSEVRSLRKHSVASRESLMGSEVSSIFTKGNKDGWQIKPLGEYLLSDSYGTSEKTSDDDSGTPVLRMGNIKDGRVDLKELKYLHFSEREREKLLLKDGDILVNRTNSAELVGKCAVFRLPGEYSFASYLIRLRVDTSKALPELVAYFINSPLGRAYMLAEKRQMTGQANVNATKLKALPIALPSLDEQERIVARLDSLKATIDALKRTHYESDAEIDALLPAILDKAFRGELV